MGAHALVVSGVPRLGPGVVAVGMHRSSVFVDHLGLLHLLELFGMALQRHVLDVASLIDFIADVVVEVVARGSVLMSDLFDVWVVHLLGSVVVEN